MLPVIPAWLLAIMALFSAHIVRREQGFSVSIPRYYVAGLYLVITFQLLGDHHDNNALYVAVNRYGFLMLFLADVVPDGVRLLRAWLKRWRKQ